MMAAQTTETQLSAEELAAKLAEAEHDLAQVRRASGDQIAKLEAELHAARQHSARLHIELEQTGRQLADAQLAYRELVPVAPSREGGSPLGRQMGDELAGAFSHFFPQLETGLMEVKRGRIPVIRLFIDAELAAPKELPELPGAPIPMMRKDVLARAELLRRQGYAPLVVHFAEKNDKRKDRAQWIYVTGCKADGSLAPPDVAEVLSGLEASAVRLGELVKQLRPQGGAAEPGAALAAAPVISGSSASASTAESPNG